MIRYSLACVGEHEFEAWFSNSKAYDTQRKKALVECPVCGSTDVRKQIMAPAVRSSEKKAEAALAAKMAGEIREHIATTHDYVGDRFADEARSIGRLGIDIHATAGKGDPRGGRRAGRSATAPTACSMDPITAW